MKMSRIVTFILVFICVLEISCCGINSKSNANVVEVNRIELDNEITGIGDLSIDYKQYFWCQLGSRKITVFEYDGSEFTSLEFDSDIRNVFVQNNDCIMIYFENGYIETFEFIDTEYVKTSSSYVGDDVCEISYILGNEDSKFIYLRESGYLYFINKNGESELAFSDVKHIFYYLIVFNDGTIQNVISNEKCEETLQSDIENIYFNVDGNLIKMNDGYHRINFDGDIGELLTDDDMVIGGCSMISMVGNSIYYSGSIDRKTLLKEVPIVENLQLFGLDQFDNYYPLAKAILGYGDNEIVIYHIEG